VQQYSIKETSGKLVLFATILASGMAFLDGTVVNIAIPNIQTHLHATLTGIQWIVNGYMLMLSSLLLITGSLGDIFGRKKIFIYGIILFTISSFLCSISGSITQLILSRVLQGIGGAMMVPGSLSIINAAFEEKVRGKAIGLWSGYSGGLIALGPFLGGWLVQQFGWQSIFYINIPIGILACLLTLKFVPESKSDEKRSIDFLGTIFIFLSLLGTSYGLITGPDKGWGTDFSGISLASGIILFFVFLFIEAKVKHPLVPYHIFTSKLVTGANLVTLSLYFALNATLFFFVLNLQQVQHFPPLLAGLAMLPTILLITFLSGPAGGLADKIGPRVPMIVGPFLVGVGMFIISLAGKGVNYWIAFLPGLLLFGGGMALVIAPLTKSALAVEQKYSGAASGVNNAVARVAGLLAVALMGAVMLSIFSKQLTRSIQGAPMVSLEKQQILSQADKLGGITIPQAFSASSKNQAQSAIEDAFLSGFHVVMGVNAFLAVLAAGIAFITILPQKQKAARK
jgi:EmrB/QacA subfamily drug resistance transporter